jgi:hypothetical protein
MHFSQWCHLREHDSEDFEDFEQSVGVVDAPDIASVTSHQLPHLSPHEFTAGQIRFRISSAHSCNSPRRSVLRKFLDVSRIEEGSA